MHAFEIDGQRYGTPDPDCDIDDIDEERVVLSDVVQARARFFYEYDFGDSWRHEVVIESGGPVALMLKFATRLEGQACPPEDCGGVHGNANFLEAIADPDHEEFDDYVGWVGGCFDPEAFDLAATNAALQRVR